DHGAEAATGTFLARPLRRLLIGGVKQNTMAGIRLQKVLAARGLTAQFVGIGGGTTDSVPTTATPFVGGATTFTLDSIGSIWSGSLGTVTYVNNNNALLFGHSLGADAPLGATDNYMAGGWITGIFPSQTEPYKLGTPGALVGVSVADGYDGVVGKVGLTTPETKITATATDTSTGRVEKATSYLHQSLLRSDNPWEVQYARSSIMAALAIPSDRLNNYAPITGTATTTSKLVVSDGKKDYTLTLTNTWTGNNLSTYTFSDLILAVDELTTVNRWGIEKLQVKSIDLAVSYTPTKTLATIVGVEAPKGLKVGKNPVRAKLFQYGVENPVYVNATLTIPAGTKINTGLILTATAAGEYDPDEDYYPDEDEWDEDWSAGADIGAKSGVSSEPAPGFARGSIPASPHPLTVDDPSDEPYARTTVADIMKELGEQKANKNCQIIFSLKGSNAQNVNAWAKTEVEGSALSSAVDITATLSKKVVNYKKGLRISGTVTGPLGCDIEVYGTRSGETVERLLAKKHISSTDEMNGGSSGAEVKQLFYEIGVPALKQNTRLRVMASGSTRYLAATTTFRAVKVRAKVSLKSAKSTVRHGKKVKLTASVSGVKLKGAKVVFERKVGKKWKKIKTLKLDSNATTVKRSFAWKAPRTRGTVQLRVRFVGHTHNYKQISTTRTVRVR
ncbi:MAG: hypothetical protein LBJ07_04950, partial [Actinomycetes bacterium]|nr:hypothetical protein [Actinomycetes bacterium]